MLEFIKNIARQTGAMVVQQRSNSGSFTTGFKADSELVTSVDLQADAMICQAIRQRFPDHMILAEESAPDIRRIGDWNKPMWIIDPIDGTVNFAHGHYQVGISIAYADRGDIQSAVVYNPFLDEMFTAQNGEGARLNDQIITVGSETNLRRSIIATGFPYDKSELAPIVNRLAFVLQECADIRRIGSAAMDICWVAVGRLDGYYESLSIWDFAAAQLIAREAGATYGHFQPVPAGINPVFHNKNILVANPQLYPQLLALLQKADAGVKS